MSTWPVEVQVDPAPVTVVVPTAVPWLPIRVWADVVTSPPLCTVSVPVPEFPTDNTPDRFNAAFDDTVRIPVSAADSPISSAAPVTKPLDSVSRLVCPSTSPTDDARPLRVYVRPERANVTLPSRARNSAFVL